MTMTKTDVLAAIQDNMRSVIKNLDGRQIAESDSLVHDFGADSLQIVEIVGRTMRQLQLRVKRTQLSAAKNIGELADLFLAGA
jgi:acyl carrier protein/polyketide biosynthesis acyl carrier protein